MGVRSILPIVVLLVSAAAARADYEETERRLKTAGIDAKLRARIHEAIDEGVEFLLARQSGDGHWPRRVERSNHPLGGVAALCALALRHAGTPRARTGFDRAMAYLFPDDGPGIPAIHDCIYTAGIASMILMADRSRIEVGREIAREIARSREPGTGWWGYKIATTQAPDRGGGGKPGPPEMMWRERNLSTTQFAGLGLWAGDRLGARIEKRVWRSHLESLIRFQMPDGSWPYDPFLRREYARKPLRREAGRIVIDGHDIHASYPCGTFMGLANLLLAERALRETIGRQAALEAQLRSARWKGLDALDRDGAATLKHLRERGFVYLDTYYTLYALEKACVFAEVTEVGGIPWYRAGAEWLCDRQDEDGGWGGVEEAHSRGGILTGQEIDTAFALLFLLRISESYTPREPRPVDAGAVTPRSAGPAAKRPPPLLDAPGPGAGIEVEIAFARRILDRLRSRLGNETATNGEIVTALRRVDTAYHVLVPDDGEAKDGPFSATAAAWRAEARRLGLAAVVLERVAFGTEENDRAPVNHLAARLVGGWGPEGSPGLVEAFERHVFRVKRYPVDPELYRSGFTSLAVMDRPEAFRWLFESAVTAGPRPDEIARTREALRALRVFDRVPGALRLVAVKHLVRTFAPSLHEPTKRHARLADAIRREVLATLRHLSRDPTSGRPPLAGDPSFAEYERWLRGHTREDRSPWR